ncbi:MAG: NADH-quinone oxidoreductase subunit D [Candidatus Parvarchaeota archaeon]|nr:NADH-quinone oxidoreductase subunit D [Candidatus Rehaiarchaeum fermentans]
MNGFEINVGPAHPSTHGVLKFKLTIEGDTIKKAEAEIGFLHRGKEKAAEDVTYMSYLPFVDKIEYVSALNMELLYSSLIEKALNIQISERAKYIRTIMAEFGRIMNHLVFLAAFGEDLGLISEFFWALRERELLMDIIEEISGGRLAPVYIRPGGVFFDFKEGIENKIIEAMEKLEYKIKEVHEYAIIKNSIFKARTKGVGILKKEDAINLGVTGPNARASGINRDYRKLNPYLIYDKLDFKVPVFDEGDAYARCLVRMEEIKESIKIIKEATKNIPKGDYLIKMPWIIKIPPTYTIEIQETPRGEIGMILVSDGSERAYRLKIRSASFFAIKAMEKILEGEKIANFYPILASLDPVMGEIDR